MSKGATAIGSASINPPVRMRTTRCGRAGTSATATTRISTRADHSDTASSNASGTHDPSRTRNARTICSATWTSGMAGYAASTITGMASASARWRKTTACSAADNSNTLMMKISPPAPRNEKRASGCSLIHSVAMSITADATKSSSNWTRSMRNARRVTGMRSASRRPAARLRPRSVRA